MTLRWRRWVVVPLVAGCLLLAGCQAAPLSVTVFGNRTAVTVPAAQVCVLTSGAPQCPAMDTSNAPQLTLPAGQPLEISVPSQVAQVPWLVVFSYVNASGQTEGDRTSLFTNGQMAYVLRVPKGTQLTLVEIQNVAYEVGQDDTVDYPAVRTFVVKINS